MKSETYHIRRRLRPRGGNQFYRDYSIRPTSTFCGAPVTDIDCGWRDKAIVWNHPERGEMKPCANCIQVRADELGPALKGKIKGETK